MLLLLIASALQLSNHPFYHNSSLDLNQQVEDAAFFVPNSQHQSTQSAAMVSTCQGCHQHQDPAMPAGSIPISEETALTQDKYLQEPQQNRRQVAESESINSDQQSSSSGTQINEDFIKDEYDYLRFTHEYYEYEQGQKNIIVRGGLKKHLPFWRSIGSRDFVLDTIEHGYKIPLLSQPCKTYCKNNKSALLEPEFVSEAINDLLDRALIEKCKDTPYVVNPLTVSAHSSGKKRLILDLRVVSKHLWEQSVKYEDIKIALAYLQQGFHMIRFDLTSAYHFIDLYYRHTDFMVFLG